MKLVILAGGKGTRLMPLTISTPKPLILLRSQPIISHIVQFFAVSKVRDMAVISSRKHQEKFAIWKEVAEKESGSKIALFQETEPRGTFGALSLVRDWIQDEEFIIANGDCLVDFNLSSLISFHKEESSIIATPLFKANTAGDYSVPRLEGTIVKGLERQFVPEGEKYIVGGPYVCQPSFLDYYPERYPIDIESGVLPGIMDRNGLRGLKLEQARFFDCGTIENLEKARREW